MATATLSKPRQPRRAKPQPTTLRCTVTIGTTCYTVKPLRPNPDSGVSALIRFRKHDAEGTTHHVAGTGHGATCDCGDQVWRHEGRDDEGCRHIRAARALGLLAPAPPPPAWGPTGADAEDRERQAAMRAAVLGGPDR